MNRPPRNVWVAIGAVAAVVALGVLATQFSVDAGAYKSRFETAASGPLGLQVKVGGRLTVGFSGDLVLQATDLHVRNADGAEVLRADRATVAVALLPLLANQCRIHRMSLERPTVFIGRGPDGALNWSRRAEPRGVLPVPERAVVTVREGTVLYRDGKPEPAIEAAGVSLTARGVQRHKADRRGPTAGLSFRAKVSCRELRAPNVPASDVHIDAVAKDGVLSLHKITMDLFGGKGTGSVRADAPDSVPRYRVRFALSQFRLESCVRALSPDSIGNGALDFAADLTMRGRAPAAWLRSLSGDVTLHGGGITLCGTNLDGDFSRFESSQNLNLLDVGSVFFVGPLGVAVTKGFDFARLIGHSKGNTKIPALASTWKMERGSLRARDVAMATEKNRIAMQGSLDFVRQEFDSVTIALVDKDGCAKVRQELRGTFQKPDLKKPTILMSLLGPARKVYKRAKDLLPGSCTPFYTGSIEHPG